MVNPQHIMTKGGAHVGDVLILTKPLGTGILTTAGKQQSVSENDLQNAMHWMMQLNRDASLAARAQRIQAVTDITGYGLLGHAYEMAIASDVQFCFEFSKLPVLDGALALAKQGSIPGGTARNRDYLRDKVLLPENLSDEAEALVFDPQTSGGLLMAVPPEKLEALQQEFQTRRVENWIVGNAQNGSGIRVK
jgi:selenide,water dikinase